MNQAGFERHSPAAQPWPTLHVRGSAALMEALQTLARGRDITIVQPPPDATVPHATTPVGAELHLHAVPAEADPAWFDRLPADSVPVRFHLPDSAEVVTLAARPTRACEQAAAVLHRLGLRVACVRPRTGLFLDRIRHSYFNEALALLGEGIAAARIEEAGRVCGFVDGPLAMLDEEGLKTTDALHHQALAVQGHHCECSHGHGHDHPHDHSHAHGHEHGHEKGHPHGPHPEHCHEHGHAEKCCSHEHGHRHHHDLPCSDGCEHEHDHEHHGHAPHEHLRHDHAAPDHSRHDHRPPDRHDHASVVPTPAVVQPWPRLTEEAAYVMEKMSHGLQRLGRADGGGFYDYDDWDEAGGDDEDGRELWDGLKAFIRRGTEIPDADLQDRLRFAPVVELLHALAAGVVLDIDATYAHATGEANPGDSADSTIGSPPETARRAALNLTARCGLWPTGRSPLAPIEALGEEGFERRAAELASHFGERFELPNDWRRALSKP